MTNKSKNNPKESFLNPIDKDKVAENPGLLEYAHHLGSAQIQKPDRSKIQGRSLQRMYDQTDEKFVDLQNRMKRLLEEAKELQQKMQISERIYATRMSFQPEIGHIYCLYQRSDDTHFLSMIKPDEWSAQSKHFHIATVQLRSDYTWKVLEKNEEYFSSFEDDSITIQTDSPT